MCLSGIFLGLQEWTISLLLYVLPRDLDPLECGSFAVQTMGPVLIIGPNLDPTTYHLYAIYQLGAP